MIKYLTIFAAICLLGNCAQADVMVTLPEFSGNFFDNTATFPQPSVTIGTFTYSLGTSQIIGASISGTFGNSSVNSTSLEDLFLGNVNIASCSDTGNACFNPASTFDDPAGWTYTFTSSQFAALGSGSATLSVVQNGFGAVNNGVTTLSIQTAATPEPGSIALLGGGLVAMVVFLRRRSGLGLLAVPALAALSATVTQAQVTWSATSAPVQASLSGGPWTLAEGGPVTPAGPTNYCVGGTPIVNSTSVTNTMSPFYFPYVVGKGLNMQGYFDYRPKSINEAIIAAKSTDGGKSWQFQQMVEQLTTACPSSNTNSSGNDAGQGHPHLLSFAGATWLYLLDRRSGHVDSDGLLVHRIIPTAAAPLNPLPLTSSYYTPPSAAATITRWDFQNLSVATNNSPAPSIGTGTAKPLGMTNNYAGGGFTSSLVKCDIEANAGSSDTAANNLEWRVRGGAGSGSAGGNGWNTAAPQYSQGAEFDVSTVGKSNIVLQFDWYCTNQGVRDLQVQYTSDGSTWTNVGPLQVAVPSGYINQVTIDFGALGITSVNNNSKFGVRMVSAYDPTYTGAGAPTYTGATLTNGLPVQYNNTSGNWRFDEVNILSGNPGGTSESLVNTTGLINPDGIIAQIPSTYPRKILYVSKTLGGDYTYPAAQQCTATPTGKSANHDVDVVRMAQTSDGVNFTDLGLVNGLNDPTTRSYFGIRYVAPNGSIVRLPGGKFGLFYGGGNCIDGDSDGLHAILYAESTDLTNWTVVNGMHHPIASIATATNVTDQATGTTVTVPDSTPVIGATQAWFGGRVYNPNAIVQADGHSVSMVFSGYNAGYSTDLSSYRTISQVTLSAGATPIQ